MHIQTLFCALPYKYSPLSLASTLFSAVSLGSCAFFVERPYGQTHVQYHIGSTLFSAVSLGSCAFFVERPYGQTHVQYHIGKYIFLYSAIGRKNQ